MALPMSKYVAKKQYIKTDLGHWEYSGVNVDISKRFGFVYLVINRTRNMFYIGKKQFWSYKKNTHIKTGKSLWRAYTTSSSHVNDDIKNGDEVEFHILGVFKTRAWCNYTEAWLQMCLCSLTERDDNGERKWYNNQVAPIRFIPGLDQEQHDLMHLCLKKAKSILNKHKDLEVK
jgi:hypothetical protein